MSARAEARGRDVLHSSAWCSEPNLQAGAVPMCFCRLPLERLPLRGDDAIVDGVALWDGLRDQRLHRSVVIGNFTTNLVGNVALNFDLIANAEAWPRLGLSQASPACAHDNS
jgi:hypothetical protein